MSDDGGIQYWQQSGQQEEEQTMNVYQLINKVQADIAKIGIAKDRACTQGASFKYRGIDEVYNVMAPLLSRHGLCILPRIVGRTCEERKSAKGNALFYVTVEAEFDFVSAEDGTRHLVRTYGEAMDSGDKATNKAMSIAYKNAILMTFSVPTEGDNDPDAQAHEVAPLSMSQTDVEKHLSSMSGAINVEALQAAWAAASEAAAAAKDKAAYRRFVGCANARKAALAGEEEKAA